MKTVMQQWFDELKANYPYMANEIFDKGFNKYLEKEKKQIIDACWYGHDIKHEYFNPIHYFDQTYNQNK